MNNYIVIDLEMCNVPQSKREKYKCANEIIEIGAVLLNNSFQIIDEFKTFVSPEYGRIDQYIEKLTGIRNQDTACAPKLKEALDMLFDWLPDGIVMVAWSDNDAYQLGTETRRKGIKSEKLDLLLENALDCQAMFGERMNSPKTYRLSEALIITGTAYDEGAHDALVDARNTALLFEKIMNDDEFTLSPYYTNNDYNTSAYCPFADLLANFNITA